MDIAKRYSTDESLELEGVWVDIGDGAKVRVARLGNPKYQQVYQRLMRPYRTQQQRGTVPDEVLERIGTEALAEAILLDWEGIEDEGKKLPYSKAAAMRLLGALKDFRADIIMLANEMETFRAVEIEDAEKNSSKRSSGD